MSRFATLLVASVSVVAALFLAPKTMFFVLDRFGVDKRQDAQLEELELQIRDLRARLDSPAPPPAPPRAEDDNAIRGVPVGRSPTMGPDDALVTVVAFLDYQCPFCQRVLPTLDALLEQNPDVRLVIKHHPLPFHKDAFDAAVVAECAHREGNFWPVHRSLFESQRELKKKIAELDTGGCRASAEIRALVEEEAKTAQRIGATGTPGFIINGRKLMGAQPLKKFQEAVDRARAEARASGIPAERYYVEGVLGKATIW